MDKAKKDFEVLLYKAIEKNSVKILQKALKMDFFVNASIKYKQSCMDYLVTSGYKSEALAKWSLTNTEIGLIGDISENANRPLRLAAQFNIEFAKYLLTSKDLKKRANINATNDGSSALLEAIKKGNLDFVKYLLTSPELSQKASLHKAKNRFNDPLCKACDTNQNEIIKYLLTSKDLKKPANISKFDYEALGHIFHEDNIEIFNFLIENNFIDIEKNKTQYFIKAIISDAKNIVSKIEEYFDIKPNLNELKYQEKSLFYHLAARAHYERKTHSYLNEMLEKNHYIPTLEEKKEMSHFYIYDNEKKPLQAFLKLIEVYEEKWALDKLLDKNTFNSVKRKI